MTRSPTVKRTKDGKTPPSRIPQGELFLLDSPLYGEIRGE